MKFFPLVWAGLWRKPARTSLTLISIATAFLLFGLLQAINQGLQGIVGTLPPGQIITLAPGFGPLPIAYLEKIRAVPGITHVTSIPRFSGYWKDAKNQVWPNAVDPREYMAVFTDTTLPPDQLETWIKTRTGGVVGAVTAERFGWKIGDRVTIHSTSTKQLNGSSDWEFDIVGIWDNPAVPDRAQGLLINWDYYNDGRAEVASDSLVAKNTVVVFLATTSDPTKTREIANSIDRLFANSSAETKSDPEQALLERQLQAIGDTGFIMNAIVAAVFAMLLLLLGIVMSHSVQERIPEIAVLKALGYSDSAVLALVLSEGAMLCVVGAAVGLAASVIAFPEAMKAMRMDGVGTFAYVVIPMGLGVAVFVAFVSVFVPAWRARNLALVDALSGKIR